MPLAARLKPCPSESHFGELRPLDSRGRLVRRPVFKLWVRYMRLPATPVFCRQAYQLESAIGVSCGRQLPAERKKQLLVGFQRLKGV